MSLVAVLRRCRELTQLSKDSMYSYDSVVEIVSILDRGIDSLQCSAELNRNELILLFAPTGSLQETSMENGWVKEYLILSHEFDQFTAKLNNNLTG
jgi:hypothetical protein